MTGDSGLTLQKHSDFRKLSGGVVFDNRKLATKNLIAGSQHLRSHDLHKISCMES